MTKAQRLRGLICGRYSSVSGLARQMNWGRQKLQRIISGQQVPTVQEVHELAVALKISLSEMAEFFLDCEITKRATNGRREPRLSMDSIKKLKDEYREEEW